jgi:signal transduction histidine kinase/ActR/RegA family two-component response regulator
MQNISNQSGKHQRQFVTWLLLGLSFVVPVVATLTIQALRRRVEEAHHTQIALAQILANANELEAKEYETIASEKLDTEISKQIERGRQEALVAIHRLTRLHPADPQLQKIAKDFETYTRNMREEFRLLAAEGVAAAKAYDEGMVDPAFDVLHKSINDADPIYSAAADRTSYLADLDSAAVTLFTCVMMGSVFWLFSRSRQAVELAEMKRKLLHASNEELRNEVAERKRTDEKLQEANRRLQNALDDLKAAQEQVIQHERLRAIGTMASGVAHDFNNSLVAILGYSELLLHLPGCLDDKKKARSYIEMVKTAAQDAGNVVNRLREFYRLREDNEVPVPVNISDLVGQVVALTQPKWKAEAEARGVSVNVHTQLQELPPIAGHAAELREVLTNLIFNAAEAMPRGGTITICTRRDDGYVVLAVGDTGTGMTEDVRRRCLEPFFTTKGERGTGLGLSMVYGVIQRHKGTVDIETGVGKGTTFIIRLPVQSTQPRSEPKAQPADAVQPLRVLVVDDEDAVRTMIGEYLKLDGHLVEAANSGRDGLEKLRNSRFDLVLVDRAMPDINGDQVAAAIKSANPSVPVVMLTGFGSMMDAGDEKPTGVDFIVGKPVTIDGLRAAVSKAVASVN